MRVILTGASGQLGAYLLRRLIAGGHEVVGWSGRSYEFRFGRELRPMDLANHSQVEGALVMADPGVVIHAAAMTAVDAVRLDPEAGRRINVEATAFLAEWCGQHGRRLVYTSTDLVFDGSRSWWSEDDRAEPTLAYGRTKLEAERFVLATPGGLVVRTSLMYGRSLCGRVAYFDRTMEAIRRGEPQSFFEDEFRTPISLATAADALVQLAETEHAGRVHAAGAERLSRFALARRSAEALGLDVSLVRANHQRDVDFPEPRPADVSLDTSRLMSWLPDLARPGVEESLLRDA